VTLDGAPFEYDNPHLKVDGLFDKNVFLCGEEPEKISATNLVAAIAKEISSGSPGDEVKLEFCMAVAPVGSSGIGITPRHAVKFGRKIEALQHNDKK